MGDERERERKRERVCEREREKEPLSLVQLNRCSPSKDNFPDGSENTSCTNQSIPTSFNLIF